MNNAEEIRERCKTKTNIRVRRESGMAKIDGVDEGGETEGAGGREEPDKWEEFGKVVRFHDHRQPSQQEKKGGTRDDASSVSQLVQALHHGERTRRGLLQVDGGRAASSGSALGLHLHGRREGREDVGILDCKRKGDECCAQCGGSEEDHGRMDLKKTDGVASRDWAGVCGHHREFRQRTSVDKFDYVMEHDEGNDERSMDDH